MQRLAIFRYLYVLYSLVFLLHIWNVVFADNKFDYIVGVLAILLLLISFSGAARLFKVLGGAFVVIGLFAFITSGNDLMQIPLWMVSNLSVLALLCMLPWMNSVVRVGGFDKTLISLLETNVSDLGKLYPRSSITTLVLAAFLNLSAASISQDVLKENLSSFPKKIRDSFISAATLRGFTLALLWSPLELLLVVSIFTTGVEYLSLLPWLLLTAGITFFLDAIWGRLFYRKHPYSAQNKVLFDAKTMAVNLFHLLAALVLFLVFVIVSGNIFDLEFLLTVTILIFPFAFAWSLLMKKGRPFLADGWENWKEKTNGMQNFVVLFISLSLFGNSLNESSFMEVMEKPILALSEYPLLIFIFIQVFFIFMSMFGVHPVATIGILGGVISILLEIMNPVSVAIVLVTGAVATLTVGTYGLVVTLTSMNTEQSPYHITLRNMPFALLFGTIGTMIAYFLL
ncbi:hypothetical protein [Siminovitchia sp. 179-K 8D1 HS]|uniref:hypothetical protein n=1 Tax=Siminovitchia sp. 179-K 8D1 HS TaxID=3142385 RepID=UPI0039A05C0C